MIAKRSPKRKDGGSSFDSLAKYILDAKGQGEKVEWSTVTNCESTDLDWALAEIKATQESNQRTKGDKTYHLIVSFPPGEDPTKEQLADIEAELCKAIGLADHQRLSAVHADTEHKHIHIAINKIHPQTLNMIEPYYDHYSLAEACQKLEIKHGLEVTNHGTPGRPSDRKAIAVDELRGGGIQPFADYLKDNLPAVESVSSWDDLHKVLANLGCGITKRGAGLAIINSEGLAVKASAVSREFSLKALESKLGAFVPGADVPTIKTPYKEKPRAQSQELWAEYQQLKTSRTLDKRKIVAALKMADKKAKAEIKQQYQEKRNALKRGELIKTPALRKGAYSRLKMERAAALEKHQQTHAAAVKELLEPVKLPAWRDWLADQSRQGNLAALDTLQKARPVSKTGNGITANTEPAPLLLNNYKPHVHRTGAVSYRLKDGGFTDEGKKIRLGKEPSDEAIAAALRMAALKYGNKFAFSGSPEFKARAEKIAAELRLGNFNNKQKTERQESAQITTKIDEFISERNEKRKTYFDILKHRHYEQTDYGEAVLGGVRSFGEQKAVLIKRGNEIIVKPITDKEAKQLSAIKVGQKFSISESGLIKTGRSL